MTANNVQEERRESVRVTSRNLFACRLVSAKEIAIVAEDFENGVSLYSKSDLKELQLFVGAQNALGKIREKDEHLAEFLQHLDMKMNLLLKKTSKEKSPLDDLGMRDINLSGAGLACISDREFQQDSILEVKMALLPSYSFVYCFVKVTKCKPVKSESDRSFFRMGGKFYLIEEDDREKIIQHNFAQQSLELRKRRQG